MGARGNRQQLRDGRMRPTRRSKKKKHPTLPREEPRSLASRRNPIRRLAAERRSASHRIRQQQSSPQTFEGLALSPSPSPAPPAPVPMSPICPCCEPSAMGIPAIPRGSMPMIGMIPTALSSDAIDAASPALSDLLLVLRTEEVLDDPVAPSFAAGFNPTIRDRSCPRGGRVYWLAEQVWCAFNTAIAKRKKNCSREGHCT